MKSIEQKLKADAHVFEQDFDSALHNKIMAKLRHQSQNTDDNVIQFSTRKILLSGFAMVLLGLLIFSILDKHLYFNNENPMQETNNMNFVNTHSENIFIDQVAINLETKITNPILKEQQAIINDLKHIRELMFLN